MGALAHVSACLGFAALALAMDRHHGTLFRTRLPPARRMVRLAAGWGLMVISLAFSLAAWGAAVGPVAWCLLLTAASLPVALGLTYAARGRKARSRTH